MYNNTGVDLRYVCRRGNIYLTKLSITKTDQLQVFMHIHLLSSQKNLQHYSLQIRRQYMYITCKLILTRRHLSTVT